MVVVVRHRKMFGCVDHKEPVHLKNKQTKQKTFLQVYLKGKMEV